MKQFEIREDGVKFAAIEARTPEAALRKAARAYPRRQADYHDYTGPITWRAFEIGGDERASAIVQVPSRGSRGIKVQS